jgi:hypothetical protein
MWTKWAPGFGLVDCARTSLKFVREQASFFLCLLGKNTRPPHPAAVQTTGSAGPPASHVLR